METNVPTVEGRQRDWEDMIDDERALLLNKGADYTAGQKDVDAYANFRIIYDLLKGAPITPYTVALIYGLKHVLSLITFAKTGKQESGEGLRGRHMDARNYFFILNELVPDHVNYFEEEELMGWLDEANTLFTEAVAEGNAKFDEATRVLDPAEEYGPKIAENLVTGAAEFFDENDQQWHPLSELDARKEVDNTTLNSGLETCNCVPGCCLGTPIQA